MLDLHAAIQVAMGWKHKHHYEFIPDVRCPKQVIGVPSPETDLEVNQVVVRSDELKISDVFHHIGDKVRYVYDMGDNWEHDVELRGVVNEDRIAKSPLCPSGYGPARRRMWEASPDSIKCCALSATRTRLR